jgi:hypothetical protein
VTCPGRFVGRQKSQPYSAFRGGNNGEDKKDKMRHWPQMGTVQMDDLRSTSRIQEEGPRAVCESKREWTSSPRSSRIASRGAGHNDELRVRGPPGPFSTQSMGVLLAWWQGVGTCKILWRIHIVEWTLRGCLFLCSVTVVDSNLGVGDGNAKCLSVLDVPCRHRCPIDLGTNVPRF